MFHPDQKEQYLESCNNDKKVAALFKYTERFEMKQDRDVCRMHTDELLQILSGMSKSTAVSERSRLFRYIEWCRSKGYCKINWLSRACCPKEKFAAVLDAAEDKYYISPQKYQSYVECIRAEASDPDYDLPIFMACYEGVTDYKDLVYLTTEDIDLEKGTLNLHSCGNIHVTNELLNRLAAASRVKVLNNKRQKSVLHYRFLPNSIWGNSRNMDEQGQVQKYRRRMMKLKEVLQDEKISISNLSNSGIFNYIVEQSGTDGISILDDVENPKENSNQLNQKYQKYFMEKKLALNFWEFKYRFQDYFKYI